MLRRKKRGCGKKSHCLSKHRERKKKGAQAAAAMFPSSILHVGEKERGKGGSYYSMIYCETIQVATATEKRDFIFVDDAVAVVRRKTESCCSSMSFTVSANLSAGKKGRESPHRNISILRHPPRG